GLAPARGPRARQGADSESPEWVCCGAISPEVVVSKREDRMMFGKFFMAIPIAALALGSTTACATKKFVRTSVGEVNDKVDSLGRSVEETQERTRRNEGRITEVDQKADAAGQSAQQANRAAAEAATVANSATSRANEGIAKADAVDRASKRLVFEVVLSEDQGNFKFAKTDLPDEAKAKLDELIARIKADPKGA